MLDDVLVAMSGRIRLASGRFVDPLALDRQDITIDDIAHGLSHRCRFTGHTTHFYSVAEHCLHVQHLLYVQAVPPRLQLHGLLHDASEAYLFDIAAPVKHRFPELVALEHQVQQAVWDWAGLRPPTHEAKELIRRADQQALHWEWRNVVLAEKAPKQPSQIRAEFIRRYEQLRLGVLKGGAAQ